jgi:hypothetical protein
MKCADHVEAVAFHTIDRSEPFVAESVSRELLEAARGAIVVEFCAGFEERRPGFRSPL